MNFNPEALTATATDWLSKRDFGFTPEGAQAYARWLAADPAHRAAIELLEPAWQAANRSRHTPGSVSLRDRVEQALARRRHRRRIVLSTLAAAAALVVAFVQFRPPPPEAPGTTVALRPNLQRLPDGSVVQLKGDAEIVVAFTPALRTVRLLQGEALFEVAKDAAHPFVVDAGPLSVRAVGTAFAVRRGSGEIGVLVTEGRVAVQLAPSAAVPAAAPVYLSAGAKLTVPLAEVAVTLPKPESAGADAIAAELAWRERRIEFNGTPLTEAIGYFNRANAIQLALASDDIGALRISGVFWTDDAEAFARNLEVSLGLTAFPAGPQRIILRR